jgi:hypothetical protein
VQNLRALAGFEAVSDPNKEQAVSAILSLAACLVVQIRDEEAQEEVCSDPQQQMAKSDWKMAAGGSATTEARSAILPPDWSSPALRETM